MENMQYVSLPGEGGGPSKMAEGRLHYVRTQESLRLLAIPPFIKIFHFPTQISILISQICLFGWKVESTLLEQRKKYGCDKYPLL